VTKKLYDKDIKEIDNKFWSTIALEKTYRKIYECKYQPKSEDKK